MLTASRGKHSRVLMTVSVGAALLPTPILAQENPRLSAIETQLHRLQTVLQPAIDAQIRSLQTELQRVRRDLAAQKEESHAARKDAAQARADQARLSQTPAPVGQRSGAPGGNLQVGAGAGAGVGTNSSPAESTAPASTSASPGSVKLGTVSFPQNRPTLTSSDGRASVAVGLQLHYDVGGYFQGSNRPDNRSVTRLNTFGENLRRARVPFIFKYDDFQINVTPDFGGGSPDGTPSLYEANFNWSPIKNLVATLGYYKPQLTLQDSMSSNDFLFLERPAIVDIARGIAGGDGRAVVGARWAADRYFIASYLTSGSVGSQTVALAQPQQTGAVLRLAGRAVATDDWDVHGGFSASDAFRIQRTSAGQTLTLQERPELRIDQNRLISTGALIARSAYEYGPEFGLRWRNFMLQGEYIRIGVDRTNGGATVRTPGLKFSGGYAEASWVITGEPRRYVATAGAFGSPKPTREFSLKDGGYGAFELVGRYSHVDLNDRVTRALAASATGGVFGGTQDIYAFGVNWYPNSQLRMMLDYDIINVDRLNTTGRTQIGQRIQAVALRAQAAF